MREFLPKQNRPPTSNPITFTSRRRKTPTLKHDAVPAAAGTAFNYDFTRIPVHSKTPTMIQPKLAIGTVGDIYEQEADRIAEQVTAKPALPPVSSVPLLIQRFRGQSNGQSDIAPASVEQALAGSGSPLEPTLRQDMEQRFGYDFSHVRIHTDSRAAESAQAVNALAYTLGKDVVFGAGEFSPHSAKGRRLLAHELTHAVQQGSTRPALMKQSAGLPEPKTFIILYGSGQLNPTTGEHHQGNEKGGGNFYLAAITKLEKLKASLGADAARHNIVFGYTPTEAEVKSFLNAKYSAPVAEIHIFSHGWFGGTNLGGPNPKGARPAKESSAEMEQRWLQKADLSEFSIDFTQDASITFYGCNIGNAATAPANTPFAQEISNAYGIPVMASTNYSHFEKSGGGTIQVPDKPGKMQTFTPQRAYINAEIQKFTQLFQQFSDAKRNRQAAKTEADSFWNAITGRAKEYEILMQALGQEISQLRLKIKSQRSVAERFIKFLPEPEKTKYEQLLPKFDGLMNYLDQAFPD